MACVPQHVKKVDSEQEEEEKEQDVCFCVSWLQGLELTCLGCDL